ncbi:MAG: NAD(P)-dependent oxidoreductase, partial [Thermoleophilaceae bacterium]
PQTRRLVSDPEVNQMATSSPGEVGFLGLGIMGRPMAANLARAGFSVRAWNRTPSSAEELAEEHGNVSVAGSAAEAAGAGVVISMLPDSPEVEEVLLDEGGAAGGLPEGGLAIDMSTIAPTASRAIGERLGDRAIAFLDAPVTGSRPKAESATLTIMVGGPAEAVERARPLFEAMGELVLHVGAQGHGSMVKLINNTLAAVNAAALAEGLVVAQAAGLDTAKLLEVLAAGSGESAMRELKAEPMLEEYFEPLFKLGHMRKDVNHFLGEAQRLGALPSVAAQAEQAYLDAEEAGLGERDFAAVIEPIATKFGLK